MTTATWSSVLDQTSDAGFRAWVAEFIAKCLAVGLTQTSDTGQINTATVTRAAINTDAGYAIFRFNDTQQATAPIFLKFLFGSGSATTVPRIRVQVGTASNGSGTVSGLGSANTDTISATAAATSVVALYPSYMCYVDGQFAFAYKVGASNGFAGAANAAYAMSRSVDNTGVATADGAAQTFGVSVSVSARTLNYVAGSIVTNSGSTAGFTGVIYGLTSSLVDVSGTPTPQAYKCYMALPRARPLAGLMYVLQAEYSIGTQYAGAVVGSTSRNFISAWPATTTTAFAFIWE